MSSAQLSHRLSELCIHLVRVVIASGNRKLKSRKLRLLCIVPKRSLRVFVIRAPASQECRLGDTAPWLKPDKPRLVTTTATLVHGIFSQLFIFERGSRSTSNPKNGPATCQGPRNQLSFCLIPV